MLGEVQTCEDITATAAPETTFPYGIAPHGQERGQKRRRLVRQGW